MIRDKAYLGRRLLDNRHGNVADFLAKTKTTGAAVLIEIKTPCTDLLASAYRLDVYPWSTEISRALSQVLQQRSAVPRNVLQLREDSDEQLEADMPRCVVLAGNVAQQLDTLAKRRSFERIRDNLHGAGHWISRVVRTRERHSAAATRSIGLLSPKYCALTVPGATVRSSLIGCSMSVSRPLRRGKMRLHFRM